MLPDQAKSPSEQYACFLDVLSTLVIRVPFSALYYFVKYVQPVHNLREAADSTARNIFRAIRHAICVKLSELQYRSENALPLAPNESTALVWIQAVPELLSHEMQFWMATAGGFRPHDILAQWTQPTRSPRVSLPSGTESPKVVLNLDEAASLHVIQDIAAARHVFSTVKSPSEAKLGMTPTTFLRALSAYAHLINVIGVKAEDVIVCGGTVAQALTWYLEDNERKVDGLPRAPGALLLVRYPMDSKSSESTSAVGLSLDAPQMISTNDSFNPHVLPFRSSVGVWQ